MIIQLADLSVESADDDHPAAPLLAEWPMDEPRHWLCTVNAAESDASVAMGQPRPAVRLGPMGEAANQGARPDVDVPLKRATEEGQK